MRVFSTSIASTTTRPKRHWFSLVTRWAAAVCVAVIAVVGVTGCSSNGHHTATTRPSTSSSSTVLPTPVTPPVPAPPLGSGTAKVRVNPDDSDPNGVKSGGTSNGVVPASFNAANAAYNASAASINPRTMPANRLLIPSVGIYVTLVPEGTSGSVLGLPADVVPAQVWRAAWQNSSAPLSASSGQSLIEGHLDLVVGSKTVDGHTVPVTIPGAFANLPHVTAGTVAYVTDSQGHLHAFRATGAGTIYPKGHLPTFYSNGARQLVLITCAGPVGWSVDPLLRQDNQVFVFIPVPVS